MKRKESKMMNKTESTIRQNLLQKLVIKNTGKDSGIFLEEGTERLYEPETREDLQFWHEIKMPFKERDGFRIPKIMIHRTENYNRKKYKLER